MKAIEEREKALPSKYLDDEKDRELLVRSIKQHLSRVASSFSVGAGAEMIAVLSSETLC